jgi:hypothetical protein
MSCISSTLVYADTAEGKTGQVGGWGKMVKKRTGKKIRLVTREPGGLDTIQHLIDAGIIDVWDIGNRLYPAETLDFAVKGYWPNAKDPSKLDAPTPAVWEEIGGYAFEGGTSFGEFLMEEVTTLGATNLIGGAEKAPQTYTSGQMRIAGANQTYYGIVQSRLRSAINNSQRLPVHILWTCRELKAEDDEMVSGYKEIYGPQLIGKALTPHVPSWFGRTIHLDIVHEEKLDPATKKMVKVPVRRAFFKTHFYDGQKTPYVANPRLPVEVVDEMPESVELSKDLMTMTWLFDKIDELRAKAKEITATQLGK